MKRTFSYLLIIVVFICGKQGYDLLSDYHRILSPHSASLSDIAEEVVAIPLQDAGGYAIKNARYIRQEGNHLFLLSNKTLYHFNRTGAFVRRITDPEDIQVANYVINPVNQQLIVLGNKDDIFCYHSYPFVLATVSGSPTTAIRKTSRRIICSAMTRKTINPGK